MVFFHSLPVPELREWVFSIPFPFPNFGNGIFYSRSRSRTLKSHSRSPLHEWPCIFTARLFEKAHSRNSGTGREWKKSIPEIREREGNRKNPFPKFGNGKGIKESIPKFREWEGNEKIPFPKFGTGKRMKKIHS